MTCLPKASKAVPSEINKSKAMTNKEKKNDKLG